jgi:hypothetical protein
MSEFIRSEFIQVPEELELVQNEYDDYQLRSGAKGAQSFVAQAHDWEQQNEHRRAIEAYLRVDGATDDAALIGQCLAKVCFQAFSRLQKAFRIPNSRISFYIHDVIM